MKLKEFLRKVNGKEEDIINYSKLEALEAVKRNCYALKYVKKQTEKICLEAVKRNCYALKFVDKNVFEK